MLLPAKARVALVGVVVASGGALAALGPAGLAVGQSSPPTVGQSSPPVQAQIQVNSPATLVAKGAGVNVSVTISCSSGLSGLVDVALTESVAGETALGSGVVNPDCTGTSQTFDVLVVAENGGPSGLPTGASKAFKTGVAIANAQINVCTSDGITCAVQAVEPTIKIGK